MRLSQTIAAKIFGLALFLLFLTLGLASFLLVEARQAYREMEVVATQQLPLSNSIALINDYGLRRRLAFERWFGALGSSQPNAEVVSEASANYATFTEKIDREFASAFALLKPLRANPNWAGKAQDIEAGLKAIADTYPAMNTRQRQVLELQRTGQHDRANDLLNVLNDQQRNLQSQREALTGKIAAQTRASAHDLSNRQSYVLRLAVAATVSTVLLGLLVAAVITLRLTRPVRSLMLAMSAARGGDLNQTLAIHSRDEVGKLTEAFNFFIGELRDKDRLKRMFGKYIDPRVLDQVLRQSGVEMVGGEKRTMTVLFGDLVGFTSLSERLTPAMMVMLLNRHFGLQARAVQDHQGIVDKFIGDAIMAFFGPPFVSAQEHAVLACRAALAQCVAMDTLRRELPDLMGLRTGVPAVDLRIGICTGDLVVGNLGSEDTRSYTVIGDTVNLASRLEGANRAYGTQVLISEATARAVDTQFEVREIDAIFVKGKSEPARIFELMALAGASGDSGLIQRRLYAEGLGAYRAQNWAAAHQAFNECVRLVPKDQPSRLMLDRIEHLRSVPPGAGWDGVWRMDAK